ncbi:MAG: serine/threonine-protein kinase [Planctomycetales bacterium]
MNRTELNATADLDSIVEAYESAQAESGQGDISDFLPGSDHPQFREIALELIRVDLEYGWKRGRPMRLADYRRRFPDVFSNSQLVAGVAFEEFRQRRAAGETTTRDEYARQYAIDVSIWPATAVDAADDVDAIEGSGDADFQGTGRSATFPRHHDRTGAIAQSPPQPGESAPVSGDAGDNDIADLRPGGRFAGFEIVSELGRGACARVYLARQRTLAGRQVVLKITRERTVEPDRLARLQHTNIVPIYSFHRVGSLFAICMPYFGAFVLSRWVDHLRERSGPPATCAEFVTTMALLGDATWATGAAEKARDPQFESHPQTAAVPGKASMGQLPSPRSHSKQVSYEDTILRLAAGLARGLAHAHDHGVLHLDLKPANILLTDDGQPMLLDFHLSTAATADSPKSDVVGGTLPYMSPEQLRLLESTANVDRRSDVYSFGVVMFELLTGELPFPTRQGTLQGVVTAMTADRQPVPSLRTLCPQIAPAVEAIVRRCLEPEPRRRYQSAHEIVEDLERQLSDRPLRYAANPSLRERVAKWVRRHPRATSGGSVTFATAILLSIGAAFWGVREQTLRALEAGRVFSDFEQQVPEAKAALSLPDPAPHEIDAAARDARTLLSQYAVTTNDAWRDGRLYQGLDDKHRRNLERNVGELLYLLAVPRDGQAPPAEPNSLNRPPLLEEALVFNSRAIQCFSDRDVPAALWRQRAELLLLKGQDAEAGQARLHIAEADSNSATDRVLQAAAFVLKADFRQALTLLTGLGYAAPQDFNILVTVHGF